MPCDELEHVVEEADARVRRDTARGRRARAGRAIRVSVVRRSTVARRKGVLQRGQRRARVLDDAGGDADAARRSRAAVDRSRMSMPRSDTARDEAGGVRSPTRTRTKFASLGQ